MTVAGDVHFFGMWLGYWRRGVTHLDIRDTPTFLATAVLCAWEFLGYIGHSFPVYRLCYVVACLRQIVPKYYASIPLYLHLPFTGDPPLGRLHRAGTSLQHRDGLREAQPAVLA